MESYQSSDYDIIDTIRKNLDEINLMTLRKVTRGK